MACYHPIPAAQNDPGGKVRLFPPLGTQNLALPCGGCIGCRAARATQWAKRCAHEARNWDFNTFITLTYDDRSLPDDGHLRPADLQRFIKRLRRHRERHSNSLAGDPRSSIRYFACGEYGEKNERPHYHAILFNTGFPDRINAGKDLYESDTLSRLWPYGQARLGDATPAAANYIAQYSLKKIGSGNFNPQTGEWRPAPFLRMSLKPAIGYTWLDKFQEDLRSGYLVDDGQKTGIPRSYIQRLKTQNPELHDEITYRKSLTPRGDRNDTDRLKAEEIIHKRRKTLNEKIL